MSMRLRNGLAVLIAFFVLGASSQAAVCELSCALQAGPGACHMASGLAAAAMDMPGMHCGGTMKMPSPTQDVVSGNHEGVCNHPFALAIEKNAVAGISVANAQLAAAEVFSVRPSLAVRIWAPSKSPPPLLSAMNPLFVSLRV